ncbi:MAG: TIGR02391 family protein [Elusimicrobiota bacterium]
MNFIELKKCYGRLKGIKELCFTQEFIRIEVVDDYNNTVNKLAEILEEDLASYKLNNVSALHSDPLETLSNYLTNKLLQLINYLEYSYAVNEQIVEVGSIYNSIKDEELKSRCSDILSAPANFDRVINQATLILEDRIRSKSKLDKCFVGVNLINKALHTDLSKTIIIVSNNQDEHAGICHICRGIMMSYRNPTHHYITDQFTREDALKLCVYIDTLLDIIEKSKVNK